MQPSAHWLQGRSGYFGVVDLPPPEQVSASPRACNMLRHLSHQMPAVQRLKTDYRADRVAVFIGTTSTGIDQVESQQSISTVDYHQHQELAAVAENLADYCGFRGPNMVISTACTSGSKALGLARSMIAAGWCDAAVAGGTESLNRLSCQGFDALESYAAGYCKPFQACRDGINIGEGAALFTVEKGATGGCGVALSGYAESSDAWHESAPEPTGIGAAAAIRAALADAGLSPADIDYINLHGTGTRLNDAMEARVIHQIFGPETPASSTKPVTGHTLGAAGAVEAAILWSLLMQPVPQPLPPHHGAKNCDPALPKINLIDAKNNPPRLTRAAISTSFAFGGHNAVLLLSRAGG